MPRHAQERSLLPELLERIVAMMDIIADRNFFTSRFLFSLAARGAFFVIRQHASTLDFRLRGQRRHWRRPRSTARAGLPVGERMTAGLLGQLTHHFQISEMNGESNRYRESMKS